jgi:thiamine pyrophosphokinase
MTPRPRRPADLVILVSGDPLPATLLPDLADAIDAARLTIAADGGLAHAERAGRSVDVIVGDLDSVEPRALARAREAGCEVIAHPTEKDATDLDLALELALERWDGPGRPDVLVVGGHGGRLDHLLGNLLVLTAERFVGARLRGWLGTDLVHVVRDEQLLDAAPGTTVSLLAVHGAATGVTTSGLRFPLADEPLPAGSSRGLSNEVLTTPARITVGSGVLLVVLSPVPGPAPVPVPGPARPPVDRP